MRWASVAISVVSGLGCGSNTSVGGQDGTSTSTGPPLMTTVTTATTRAPSETTATGAGTTMSSVEEAGSAFIDPSDIPSTFECDLWTGEPCARGEKCMPFGAQPVGPWAGTRCTAIARDPAAPGEPCTVQEHSHSGLDDCEAFAMCWFVDSTTLSGLCVAFCQGSELDSSCENPCDHCHLTGSGIPILCLPTCDPLAQDCPVNHGCYGVSFGFTCISVSGGAGPGEPCADVNSCSAGLVCANANLVDGCEGGAGCCTPFCEIDAETPCLGMSPSTECIPWYAEGTGPTTSCIDHERIGVCIEP